MASISHDKKTGRRAVQFVGTDGKRRSIRLGTASKRQAEEVRSHVEKLAAAAFTTHAPPDETSRWVAALPDVLKGRLAAVGLVAAPTRAEQQTLGTFLAHYLESRSDLKESTRIALGQAQSYMVECFGHDKPLRSITPGDGDEFRVFLLRKKLAAATVRRRCGAAKQFLRAAVRQRILPGNPFADLAAGNLANPERQFYVGRDVAKKVLDTCPDAEWRLIFALARYGGLRCPSEIVGLRWADIVWDRNRFLVHSPKTAHHDGQATRQVPIFTELLPHLQAAFDAAEPGAEYVITRYRLPNQNLQTQLRRILWRAGIDPWPRLFQNLRASCDTDLAARHPAHVCARWLGHTPAIAAKHYLQVTDEDFDRATDLAPTAPLLPATPEAVQKAVHSGATENPTESQAVSDSVESGRNCEAEGFGESGWDATNVDMVGDTGLEPVTSCVSSRRSSHLS